MRPKTHVLVALIACGALALAATAWATETLTIRASFTPDKLGAPTNLSATGDFKSTSARLPSPITKLTIYAPAGAKIDVQGAGTCSAVKLEELGPSGCPANSRAGFGGGTALLELAKEVIPESFTIDIFLAPKEAGHLAFLAYIRAVTPASVELVLKAKEIKAPKPYGIGFDIDVPLIPTLPEASDASVEHAFVTFGSTDVAYYKNVHGKRTLLHVKGLISPKRCPNGGFPLEGIFDFADGSSTIGQTTIPCPAK
jgi:hypothetical protein